MTKPFTVLLDLDSTVYDLLNPTLDWVNKTYGRDIRPKDIHQWHWNEQHGVDPYQFWNQKGVFSSIPLIEGAQRAIAEVSRITGVRQVFFSTIVTKYAAWEKFDAVDRDFPFIGRKNVLLTGGLKNVTNGDMLVDDGPHNLSDFAAHGGRAVLADLYGAGYCKVGLPEACTIMTSWDQYPGIVLDAMDKYSRWSENVG